MILALCFSDATLGVAAYDESRNAIFTEAFAANKDDVEACLTAIKLALNPTLLLIHPRIVSNQEFLEICRSDPHNRDNLIYSYASLKSSQWAVESCRNLVASKLFLKMGNRAKPSNFYALLASKINLDSAQVCSSLGALMHHLASTHFLLDNGCVTVSDILPVPSLDFMRLDGETLKALSIFVVDQHPNVIKSQGRAKEGFSLFSYLDQTKSLPGRVRLKDWMRKPLVDLQHIKDRADALELLQSPDKIEWCSEQEKRLRKYHDLPNLLIKLKKAEAAPRDWVKLHSTLQVALKIAASLEKLVESFPEPEEGAPDCLLLRYLVAELDGEALSHSLQVMTSTLDCPAMQAADAIVIRAGYDEELDRMRYLYDNLETYLSRAARETIGHHPNLPSLAVEYVPQIGFVLAVATDHVPLLAPPSFDENQQLQYQARQQQYRQMIAQQQQQQLQIQQQQSFLSPEEQYLYGPPPLPVMIAPPSPPQPPPRAESDCLPIFSDAGKSFFKNLATDRLDSQLGDLKSNISDLQKKILLSVEDVVLDSESQMQRLNECISTLDVLLALATASKSGRMVRPEIVPERVVAIKGGRHPLQELVVDTFIANDTYIDSAQNVGIITGPNSSGKSIYLKQVGLIVYLAMLGMFVPAERAVVGQCRGILTRISSVEGLSTPLSAFTLDLAQMARLLASYSDSTICLIDEFGKGTSPSDGIALLAAIIKHLTSPSNPKAKPLTLIATHFTEILHPRILGATVNSPCLLYQMLTMTRAQAASAAKESNLRAGKALTLEEMDEEDDQTQTQPQMPQAEGDDEPTSLFRLVPGAATDSLGIACAQKAGLPQEVVARAQEVKGLIAAKKIISPICLSNNRIPADPAKRALLRSFLQRSTEDWAAAGDKAALAQLKDLIAM